MIRLLSFAVVSCVLILAVMPIGCARSSPKPTLTTPSLSATASPSSSSVTTRETDAPTGVVDQFLRDETNWDVNAMLSHSCVEARSDLQAAIVARQTPPGSDGQSSTPVPGELSVRIHVVQTAADSARIQVEGSIAYAPPMGVVDITGVYTVRRENGEWCLVTSSLSGSGG
jgi:hypothetical protein